MCVCVNADCPPSALPRANGALIGELSKAHIQQTAGHLVRHQPDRSAPVTY